MEKKDSNLGVCQRLFNFIMNSIIARSLRRVTMGHQLPRGSKGLPVEGGDSLRNGMKNEEEKLLLHPAMPEENLSNEVVIEFRHEKGLEYWTAIDNLGSSIHRKERKGSIISSTDQNQMQKNGDEHKDNEKTSKHKEKEASSKKETPLVQAKGSREAPEQVLTSRAREKGLKKSVSLKTDQEKEKNKKKEKSIPTERLTPAIDHEHEKSKPPPRLDMPVLSVGLNINEKSDAFIRSRKEAMRRNLSLEPKSSK